ncbi:pyridoxal-phosphate dependent enzyme [Bradyrhizobium sp.]|jgi:threonine dehydratase|uniref:pyridoxal-phosphate dependent enzyme n=1 Tax=Bradyrhizobium sp. TaxID=376 RepID=UPI003C7E9844
MQHAGSFNVRGVFTNLLTREVPATGVVAASGGNHGVAVAFAANRLDRKAAIFVPTIASPSKIELIRRHGAELHVGGDRYADALAASEHHVVEHGALPIHAFDQAETMLGQGTVGLEIARDAPGANTTAVNFEN